MPTHLFFGVFVGRSSSSQSQQILIHLNMYRGSWATETVCFSESPQARLSKRRSTAKQGSRFFLFIWLLLLL